jgi:hypothetical protein
MHGSTIDPYAAGTLHRHAQTLHSRQSWRRSRKLVAVAGDLVQSPEAPQLESINFALLGGHDPLLLRLCSAAETYCSADPNTALLKLRQFGEALARSVAANIGIDTQADLLGLLQRRGCLDRDVAAILHTLRREATMPHTGSRPRPARPRSR